MNNVLRIGFPDWWMSVSCCIFAVHFAAVVATIAVPPPTFHFTFPIDESSKRWREYTWNNSQVSPIVSVAGKCCSFNFTIASGMMKIGIIGKCYPGNHAGGEMADMLMTVGRRFIQSIQHHCRHDGYKKTIWSDAPVFVWFCLILFGLFHRVEEKWTWSNTWKENEGNSASNSPFTIAK